ncbi:hypothetical protein FRC10_001153, partial [Ceratobasidium sp. 414]
MASLPKPPPSTYAYAPSPTSTPRSPLSPSVHAPTPATSQLRTSTPRTYRSVHLHNPSDARRLHGAYFPARHPPGVLVQTDASRTATM